MLAVVNTHASDSSLKNQYLFMKCIKPILLATAFFFMAGFQSLRSQTTLAAGDILFTGFNGIPSGGIAPDTFSFVLLTPISSGTVIYFTERGYQGGPWQASGSTEGTISVSYTHLDVYKRQDESGAVSKDRFFLQARVHRNSLLRS